MFNNRLGPLAVLSDLHRLSREMDSTLQLTGPAHRKFAAGFPPINMWETEESVCLEMELPGFKQEDLDISIQSSTLVIQGERSLPETEGANWRCRERGYGKFHRAIELSAVVDAENVQATFKDGILLLDIPKREESRPRKIEVKTE